MIKTYKPVTPGLRTRKSLVRSLTVSEPQKSLIASLKGPRGRSHGKISSRHSQRGTKKYYRLIDFKRNKFNIPAKVATIEHDPNRGSSIALLHYTDGEKRYILAPEGLTVGMTVVSGEGAEPTLGNALPIGNIPLSAFIHNIELNPKAGGVLVRGAGNSAQILAKEGNYVNVKLPSGEVRKVLALCYATVGILGNSDLRNTRLGKAGRNRHLGNRPHIRGVAIANPSDHPHGGSYKDNGIGMPSPKSPWGWKTRGVRTRRRTQTNKFIVSRRISKRKK